MYGNKPMHRKFRRKTMKRREDIYNLGNDYFQDTKTYFRTTSAEVEAVSGKSPIYSDGLYHYTQEPVYELSGGASALNKRIFNVPQTTWGDKFDTIPASGYETFSAINDASAVFTDGYATGVLEAISDWSETPKAKKD